MNLLNIHYQVVDLDVILRHYSDGFKPREGEKIVKVEVIAVDTNQGRVVFKIYTQPEGAVQESAREI